MKKERSQESILSKLINKNKKAKVEYKWVFSIMALAFCISVLFSIISELTLSKVNVFIGIIILLIFIFIGIIFDLIGVAVTTADQVPFHSMAARKVKAAKTAIKLSKSADKVSSICNDVVGDICGIISGSAGALIIVSLSKLTSYNPLLITLVVTGIIASLTIGGKAICKSVAINNADLILYELAKVVNIFSKEK